MFNRIQMFNRIMSRITTVGGKSDQTEVEAVVRAEFDADFYLSQCSGFRDAVLDPVEHYLSTGWREGLNPDPNFSSIYYIQRYPDVQKANLNPYYHYLQWGRYAGRFGTPNQEIEAAGVTAEMQQEIEEVVRTEFDIQFYYQQDPNIEKTGIDPVKHYVSFGWRRDLDPSPFFSTNYYFTSNPDVQAGRLNPFYHYLKWGRLEGRSSRPGEDNTASAALTEPDDEINRTIRSEFDAEFYYKAHPEIRNKNIDPVKHYRERGWLEGFDPSPKFSTRRYLQNSDVRESGINPFFHYLKWGRDEGRSGAEAGVKRDEDRSGAEAGVKRDEQPSVAEAPWLTNKLHAEDVGSLAALMAHLATLMPANEDLFDIAGANKFLLAMFNADYYKSATGLPAQATAVGALLDYLVRNLSLPSVSPLFDAKYYAELSRQLHLPSIDEEESPFLHWVKQGVPRRVVPTPLFDEKTYLQANSDLENYPGWLFDHFVFHGIAEGRKFLPWFPSLGQPHRQTSVGKQAPYLFQFLNHRVRSVDLDKGRKQIQVPAVDQVMQIQAALKSRDAKHAIAAAAKLEPAIRGVLRSDACLLPPWHDEDYLKFQNVRAKIRGARYDNIVFIPFCKLGGADFVAGILTKALQSISQDESTLVLRTDRSDFNRPDWFASDADNFDLSEELNSVNIATRIRMLYVLMMSFSPRRIFNVNSRACFQLFERFGKRLSRDKELYAYYFCADQDKLGHLGGYPISHFAPIAEFLAAALVDTQSLADELKERFRLPSAVAARVQMLYTPAMSPLQNGGDSLGDQTPQSASSMVRSRPVRNGPVIFWAGRLDRQKRFDLVEKIAARMPDVTFRCWGVPVLDAPRDMSTLPPNIVMEGTFKYFSDLSMKQADGWLYTSAWDGLPTILIECGAHGMSIVASEVGGVGELITDETGWPVREIESIDAYVAALREMLGDPEERARRAERLKALVESRHNFSTYADQLRSIMARSERDA
jgi:glycosyltransferase involved in cell wall biosynthesis